MPRSNVQMWFKYVALQTQKLGDLFFNLDCNPIEDLYSYEQN